MKGTESLEFYWSAKFVRDSDATFCMSPKWYIVKWLIRTYEKMFGEKTKIRASSPLEQKEHLELAKLELLDKERSQEHLLLSGAL